MYYLNESGNRVYTLKVKSYIHKVLNITIKYLYYSTKIL